MYMYKLSNEIKDYIGWTGNVTITENELILSKENAEDIIFVINSDIIKMRIISGKELESYGIKESCGYTFIYLLNLISKILYIYK